MNPMSIEQGIKFEEIEGVRQEVLDGVQTSNPNTSIRHTKYLTDSINNCRWQVQRIERLLNRQKTLNISTNQLPYKGWKLSYRQDKEPYFHIKLKYNIFYLTYAQYVQRYFSGYNNLEIEAIGTYGNQLIKSLYPSTNTLVSTQIDTQDKRIIEVSGVREYTKKDSAQILYIINKSLNSGNYQRRNANASLTLVLSPDIKVIDTNAFLPLYTAPCKLTIILKGEKKLKYKALNKLNKAISIIIDNLEVRGNSAEFSGVSLRYLHIHSIHSTNSVQSAYPKIPEQYFRGMTTQELGVVYIGNKVELPSRLRLGLGQGLLIFGQTPYIPPNSSYTLQNLRYKNILELDNMRQELDPNGIYAGNNNLVTYNFVNKFSGGNQRYLDYERQRFTSALMSEIGIPLPLTKEASKEYNSYIGKNLIGQNIDYIYGELWKLDKKEVMELASATPIRKGSIKKLYQFIYDRITSLDIDDLDIDLMIKLIYLKEYSQSKIFQASTLTKYHFKIANYRYLHYFTINTPKNESFIQNPNIYTNYTLKIQKLVRDRLKQGVERVRQLKWAGSSGEVESLLDICLDGIITPEEMIGYMYPYLFTPIPKPQIQTDLPSDNLLPQDQEQSTVINVISKQIISTQEKEMSDDSIRIHILSSQ